jgi:maltose alpha-D-glucosyltransferase/alpha-amylase
VSNPVLCVHNLSRFAQPAALDLTRWAQRSPVELLGRIPFPPVSAGTYEVTLGPHGFYWFELLGEQAEPGDLVTRGLG